MDEILKLLSEFGSWKLERCSVKTYPRDTMKKMAAGLKRDRVMLLLNRRHVHPVYRCRVGTGEYEYGTDLLELVKRTIEVNTLSGVTQ